MQILKKKDELSKIKQLLDTLYLTEWPGSQDIFLLLGYKKLSLGAKETYQVLRNLAISTYKSSENRGYVCQVSYEFLATALSTSRITQIKRIKELAKYNLITPIKKYNSTNSYIVEPRPYPDKTFEETLQNLILRKECLGIIYTVKSFKDLKSYPEQWNQLSDMYNNPFCKDLILQRFSDFYPFQEE